jgi:uncharacterized protein (DUF433 family)
MAPPRAQLPRSESILAIGIGDDVIGATRPTAARVIGVTENCLRSWNNRGLVLPSFLPLDTRGYWTYALDDIVQGRVVRQLEEAGHHVRVIRRIVEAIRTSTYPKPLAKLVWAVAGRDIFVQYPDGQWVNGRRPAQGVMTEVINLDRIRVDAREALRRPSAAAGHTERRRGRLGNKEVFAGTRVPLTAVLPYLRRGAPDAEILEAFPDLTPTDIELARARAS